MNLNELKKLAEAATPGPWVEGISSHHTVSKHPKFFNYTIAEFRHARDAEWCDAANPQQVLKMIECMELMVEALYPLIPRDLRDEEIKDEALAAFHKLNSEE